MKYLILIYFMILSPFSLKSQTIINFEFDQSIGNQWGEGKIEDIAIDDFWSLPITGSDVNWDYSFIGALDNGSGVLFSDAEINDFAILTFQNLETLPLEDGGTAQDSFPTGVGAIMQGDPGDYSGIVLEQNNGLVRTGVIEEDGGEYEINQRESFYIYPFDLNTDEFIDFVRAEEFISSNFIDSTITVDTFAYIGNGTLKMYYGNIPNVVLYKQTTKEIYRSYNINTGQSIGESISYYTSYLFLQNENLIPIIYYNHSSNSDWAPATENLDVFVYVPFFPILNSINEELNRPLGMTLSPNPASEKVEIKYKLKNAATVEIDILTIDGKKIATKMLTKYSDGFKKESISIPNELSSGVYIVRIKAGNTIETKIIIIEN